MEDCPLIWSLVDRSLAERELHQALSQMLSGTDFLLFICRTRVFTYDLYLHNVCLASALLTLILLQQPICLYASMTRGPMLSC